LKILVACEESQIVTEEFRKRGYEAFSCDLEPSSGNLPQYHIQDDVKKVLFNENWAMLIAHPPCTYLAVAGNKWFLPKYKDRFPDREERREEAVEFFMMFINSGINLIAVENPVGIMSTRYRKPDQYVHPYHFGDPYSKKTGWWLINLPKLVPTNIVDEGEKITYASGRTMPKWYAEMPAKDRSKRRSKTFPGMAAAIADQWGRAMEKYYQEK